jgi:hypothetical protein
MTGLSRLKNGVASLAYVPAIKTKRMDASVKPAHDQRVNHPPL